MENKVKDTNRVEKTKSAPETTEPELQEGELESVAGGGIIVHD